MKYVIYIISLLVLISCKGNMQQEIKTKTVEQTVEAKNELQNDEVLNVYENAWKNVIQLNNGNKWQANKETNEGVQEMKNSIKIQTTSTLGEYHILAEQLNDDKKYIIKNCTMKGASHENLHIWLLPLMAKIEALSGAKTVEDASKIKYSIEENINAYSDYFE